MIEHDLGQYLTDAEKVALSVDRQTIVARTLGLQIKKLQLYGAKPDHIHDDLANMRTKFEDLSTETIEKIQKNLFEHVAYLIDDQSTRTQINASFEHTPNLTIVTSLDEPASLSEGEPTQISEQALMTDDAASETEPIEESEDAPKNNFENIEIPEIDDDDRRPKGLPVAVNNLFNGIFTYEQRAALLNLDTEQRTALLRAFHETVETHSNKPKYAPLHADRLGKLISGMDITHVAELEGQTTGAITTAFKNTVNGILRNHRPEFIRKYMSYLDDDEIPEVSEETLVSSERPVKQEIPRPEGMHVLINNLLSKFLNYEQREAVAGFNDTQVNELVALFDQIYEENAVRLEQKERHISRIKSFMNGAETREVAIQEGVKPLAIVQGFTKTLPGIFVPYKDRIIKELESIYAAGLSTDGVPEESLEVVETVQSHHNGVSITETQSNIAVPSESAVASEEIENKPEPLVEVMMGIYKTADPQARKGIEELFSLEKGVIASTDESVEAARYLAHLVQAKGIKVPLEIANPNGRIVVERLLNGIQNGDERQYATLSEIIANTHEGMRQAKLNAAKRAFEKLASKFENSVPVRVDTREQQINFLRSELPKYIELDTEITNQIIDRAMGKEESVFSSDLAKGLVQLHRIAAGVGLNENELDIIRLFARPRATEGKPPRTINEIREELMRSGSKYRDDEYVPSMLLRSMDKIVTQRRDG